MSLQSLIPRGGYVLGNIYPVSLDVDPGKLPGPVLRVITSFDGRDGWRALEKALMLEILQCHPTLTRKVDWYPQYDAFIPHSRDQWVIERVFDNKRVFPFSTSYLQKLLNKYAHRLMASIPLGCHNFKIKHFNLLKPLYWREVYYGFHSEEEELTIDDFDVVGNLSELFPARVGKPLQYAESLRVFLAKEGWLLVRGNERVIMMG